MSLGTQFIDAIEDLDLPDVDVSAAVLNEITATVPTNGASTRSKNRRCSLSSLEISDVAKRGLYRLKSSAALSTDGTIASVTSGLSSHSHSSPSPLSAIGSA